MAGTRPAAPTPTLRATVSGTTGSGSHWANVFWLHSGSAESIPTISQLQGFCDEFALAFKNHLMPQMAVDWHLTLSQAIAYASAGSAIAAETTHAYAGTKSGTTVPDSVAGVLSWQIGQTWRGGKPRTYLGGIIREDLVDMSHFGSTAISDRHSAALDFLNAANGTTWPGGSNPLTMGTVSFFSGNAPRSPAIFVPYIGVSIHSRVDTMRRRLGRET